MEKNALVSKRMSRRSFLHAAAATAGVMVTAACAAPAPAAGDSMDSGGDADMETVELRLAYWGFQVEKQGALQAAFQEAYPDIKLQEDITSWSNYWQKMLASTAAGDSPDIMHHSPYYHVRFAHNGVTIPLDPFVERDGVDLNDFYEGAITQGRWQPGTIRCGSGDLHAFPTVWHSGTMWFWNKNWFAEKGIPDPDESWTWDTIVEAGKEFTVINDDGSAESYGMDKPVDGNSRMNFWIFQAGGAFYDEDYNGCLIKEDAPMEAFQWMTDLVNEHKVAMPPEANLQFNPFETGRVAFAVMGDWMIPSFSEIEEFEWDVFTPPAHPVTGENTIDAYQNGISITSSAPHPDESWEYIKWLTMGDGAVMYAETIFPFPAHIPTAEGLIYVQDRTDPPTQLWILNQLLKDATSVFNGPAEGEIASIAVEEQEAAMLQVKTVAEATDDLESRVNAVLERSREELLG